MDVEKIIKTVLPYVIIIIVVILLKTFVVTTIRVNGTSMMDTLHHGDIMILDRISYKFNKINRFDIVVVHHNNEDMIKRVIGLPGDKVKYVDNQLYINDQLVEENFSHKKTEDFDIQELGVETIPEGQYLVLGDNRTNSYDGRFFGLIPQKEILGHAIFTIYPFNRFGMKA